MRKLFSLFAAVLFAGSMFAAESVYKQTIFNASNNSEEISAYTSEWTNTTDGFTVNIVNANNNKNAWEYIKMGAKKANKADANKVTTGSLATAAVCADAVSKIVVTGSLDRGSVATKLIIASNAAFTSDKVEITGPTAFTEGKMTFTVSSPAENRFYKLEFVCTNTTTSNGVITINTVEYYHNVVGAPETPTFSIPAGVYGSAKSVELACETTGAEIRYTLDGTDPTSTSALYESPISVAVTTTIKAVAIKNSISSGIASATYKIVELDGEGTKANPYSVADLAKLENPGDTAWVKGYILGGISGTKPTEIDNTQSGIIALGATADADEFIPVQLVNSTDPRAALNVVDNPGNIGKLVKVRGALQNYCSTTGVKGTCEYEIVSTTAINNTAVEGKAVKTIKNGQLFIEKNGVVYNVLGEVVR